MEKPKIYISRAVFNKIMYWIDMCPLEIGGMGTLEYNTEENYFHVLDVFLLEQEVSATTTDLNDIALGKLEHETIKNKIKGELNFWWHSHVNMGVFWSGTDKETIETFGHKGYCVATVFNKKREMRSAVCAKLSSSFGGEHVSFIDELPTIIFDPQPSEKQKEEWKKQYQERVKEKTWKSSRKYNSEFSEEDYRVMNNTSKPNHKNGFIYNRANWEYPQGWKIHQRYQEWLKIEENSGAPNEAEGEWILNAASTGYSLSYFNHISKDFAIEDWKTLEDLYDKFKEKNPDFAWIEGTFYGVN